MHPDAVGEGVRARLVQHGKPLHAHPPARAPPATHPRDLAVRHAALRGGQARAPATVAQDLALHGDEAAHWTHQAQPVRVAVEAGGDPVLAGRAPSVPVGGEARTRTGEGHDQ